MSKKPSLLTIMSAGRVRKINNSNEFNYSDIEGAVYLQTQTDMKLNRGRGNVGDFLTSETHRIKIL